MLRLVCTWCIAGALLLVPQTAHALKFRIIENDGFGARVLLVHDCEALVENTDCTDASNHFSAGDERRFRENWIGRIDEVWLLSGGGFLDAGISIAGDLRSRGATVRVPNAARLLRAGFHLQRNYHCVSACTVTFMGGLFRFIDPDATYEVHAASSVSWGNLESEQVLGDITRTLKILKERGLRAIANDRTDQDRDYLYKMFVVFQEAVWHPLSDDQKPAERRRRDQALSQWVREGLTRGYAYADAQLARDQNVLALEGVAALQDILMRIERDSMRQAVEEIRSMLPALGRRGDAALAMVAAMFDTSSIKETNLVPRETLVKMGYITEIAK